LGLNYRHHFHICFFGAIFDQLRERSISLAVPAPLHQIVRTVTARLNMDRLNKRFANKLWFIEVEIGQSDALTHRAAFGRVLPRPRGPWQFDSVQSRR